MPVSNTKPGTVVHLSSAIPDEHIALRGVLVESRLEGLCQRTVVSQTFINLESVAIEAIYTFPLPSGAAVCGFEIVLSDRVLTGTIDEAEKAIEKYEKAVAEGDGAFIAESNRPDVFTTRVGNMKPKQAVTIRLTYVSQLTVNERVIRVAYPTTLAPRYAGRAGMDPLEADISADTLNPPHVLSVPYGLTLKVDVDLGVTVQSIASPTHGIKVATRDTLHSTVTFAAGAAEMNRDVVLEVEFAKENAAGVQVESGPAGDDASFIAATFVPEFDVNDLAAPAACETFFVIDCSGSMEGASIKQAKQALALCLRSMNVGDRFNICRFGSGHELMSPEPVVYSEETLKSALSYINHIMANMGGTEIYDPLNQLLSLPASPTTPRFVVLLTDGQVSNEPAVVALGAKYRSHARVFSFGIGPAVSEYLVKGLAQATGGAAEFISQGERIEEKVLRQFSRMGSPMVSNIQVEWGAAVEQAGAVTALFDGDAVSVIARVPGALPREVAISCIANGKPRRWVLPVPVPASRIEKTLPLLWAMKRIEEADDSTKIAISKKYGVLCDKTSFIAIEHRSVEERTQGLPALRRVPVMLAKDWGAVYGGFPAGGGAAAACAAPAPAQAAELCDELAQEESAPPRSMPRPAPAAPPKKSLLGRLGDSLREQSFRRRASKMDAAANATIGEGAFFKDAAPQDELSAILSLQTAEGSFDDGAVLAQSTLDGKPWPHAKLRAELAAITGNKKAIATALAMIALAQRFDAKKSLWKRAYDKAHRWLTANADNAVIRCMGAAKV